MSMPPTFIVRGKGQFLFIGLIQTGSVQSFQMIGWMNSSIGERRFKRNLILFEKMQIDKVLHVIIKD
jgi:hypothetical protein